ncbi:MAG: NUDIX domain-containing protein [Opitutae bacterium]|mgnify:CR=1 FL=1|jgi:isopentenyldiphosphate isomerase|nr:NUDIX domain-containing protein [Opitutae bacterium]MBT5716688.1 NUDIX domain-containing protein [Opitutae bacterium]
MDKEIFDVVNLSDQVVRQASRIEVHKDDLFHRAVHIMVSPSPCQWILQKRSGTKDIDPLLWTSSCSGHVDFGEHYIDAAVRECAEELGIVTEHEFLIEIFRTSPCRETGNEFVRFYLLKYQKKINFNTDEVLQTKEFSIGQIEQLIQKHPEDFSGSFIHLFPFLKKGVQLNEGCLP